MFQYRKRFSIYCFLLSSFFGVPVCAAESALDSIEESFAISTLMSDSEALTFGFTNFDIESEDPGFGDEDSSNYKNSLNVFVIPYTWDLEPKSDAWDHAITVRAFYINTESDSEIYSGVDDTAKQETMGIYGNYSQFYHVTDNWYVTSALGFHLTYYSNEYDYGDGFPEDAIDELDGDTLNISAWALITEPEVGIGYEREEKWGTWRAHNKTNYIYGQSFAGTINDKYSVNPEGWRVTNGVEFTVGVPELWGVNDFLTIDFKRIDLFGDLEAMADDGYYYETSVGWVIDTNNKIPFLDNIGIGVSVNYGSSISGATVVLYWNE
ncbi:Solitary outer membrane autotransporter beta-barrel domain [Psychromonas sp. KJ10-2]|uniref:Solitary outer membrane autotransporter beta-barrel domain n=1 Tax=Psychromonas sp. KJ10-2 TaxID=3391822 RepID=UPI0039B418E4